MQENRRRLRVGPTALGPLLLAGALSCTFPSYLVESGVGAAAGQSMGAVGTGGTGAASGAASGGASMLAGTGNTAGGSLGEAGGAGSAGQAGDDPGLVLDWSAGSLTQLDLALLGSAQVDAHGVALTQDVKHRLGGLMTKQQLDLNVDSKLHLSVGFRITAGHPNGDGLALVLHASPDGPTRIGSGGGGLGYGGLSPCLAIEIDTAEIAAADLPAPHLGLMPGCNPDAHGPSTTALGGDPSDGADWTLDVVWSKAIGIMDVTLRNGATGRETSLSEPLDLTTLVGSKLFVGVMAATGEFHATHLVHRFHVSGGGAEAFTLTSSNAAF